MLAPIGSSGASATWNGPKHRRFGRAGRFAVVDRVDQHRHAEHVGQQDEFLPPFVAHVAGVGEEHDRLEPFVLGRFDLLHRLVQLAGDHFHDGFQPLVLAVALRLVTTSTEFSSVKKPFSFAVVMALTSIQD
jgi:hypothetical protein